LLRILFLSMSREFLNQNVFWIKKKILLFITGFLIKILLIYVYVIPKRQLHLVHVFLSSFFSVTKLFLFLFFYALASRSSSLAYLRLLYTIIDREKEIDLFSYARLLAFSKECALWEAIFFFTNSVCCRNDKANNLFSSYYRRPLY
jgi:hypothetical protein